MIHDSEVNQLLNFQRLVANDINVLDQEIIIDENLKVKVNDYIRLILAQMPSMSVSESISAYATFLALKDLIKSIKEHPNALFNQIQAVNKVDDVASTVLISQENLNSLKIQELDASYRQVEAFIKEKIYKNGLHISPAVISTLPDMMSFLTELKNVPVVPSNEMLDKGICLGATLTRILQKLGKINLPPDVVVKPSALARYLQAHYKLFYFNLDDKKLFQQEIDLYDKLNRLNVEISAFSWDLKFIKHRLINPQLKSLADDAEKILLLNASEALNKVDQINDGLSQLSQYELESLSKKEKKALRLIQKITHLCKQRDPIYQELLDVYDRKWEQFEKGLDPELINHFKILTVPLIGKKESLISQSDITFLDFLNSTLPMLIQETEKTKEQRHFILGLWNEPFVSMRFDPSVDEKVDQIVGENAPLPIKERVKAKLIEKVYSPYNNVSGHAIQLSLEPGHYELYDVNTSNLIITADQLEVFKLKLLTWWNYNYQDYLLNKVSLTEVKVQ